MHRRRGSGFWKAWAKERVGLGVGALGELRLELSREADNLH